jgi:hypothetical protein
VEGPPLLTLAGEAVAEVAAVLLVQVLPEDTVMVTEAQLVVLPPSARTKYVVVAVGVTVRLPLEPEPVPTKVAPQAPLYHFQLPQEPRLPPDTESDVAFPLVILVLLADAPVGFVELVQELPDEDV